MSQEKGTVVVKVTRSPRSRQVVFGVDTSEACIAWAELATDELIAKGEQDLFWYAVYPQDWAGDELFDRAITPH